VPRGHQPDELLGGSPAGGDGGAHALGRRHDHRQPVGHSPREQLLDGIVAHVAAF